MRNHLLLNVLLVSCTFSIVACDQVPHLMRVDSPDDVIIEDEDDLSSDDSVSWILQDAPESINDEINEDPAEDETPEEDDGPDPDPDCGFWTPSIYTGEEFTLSYGTFEMLDNEVDFVQQGDPLSLTIEAGAHECGDIAIVIMQYTVQDVQNQNWLEDVIGEEATVSDSEDTYSFDDAPANGVVIWESDELHFTWSDGYWPIEYDNTGGMDTILIPAGESVEITFTFPHSEGAPIGTTVDVIMTNLLWIDVGTGQMINQPHGWDLWRTLEFTQ